jgi:hypothetical protein
MVKSALLASRSKSNSLPLLPLRDNVKTIEARLPAKREIRAKKVLSMSSGFDVERKMNIL